MATPIRLYLVDSKTGRKTGKKRDYPSVDHFNKYGIDTYERYNQSEYFTGRPTGTKAEICYLDCDTKKWVTFEGEQLELLIKGYLTED